MFPEAELYGDRGAIAPPIFFFDSFYIYLYFLKLYLYFLKLYLYIIYIKFM